MTGKSYAFILKTRTWQWLLISITISESLTLVISFFASHILWRKLPREVLIIGFIDAFLVSIAVASVLIISLRIVRNLYNTLEEQNRELSQAISEIKTLQGILPICSYCKQIRNDKGYYEQIEDYIHTHSGVDFSHTICPACMEKHHPIFKTANAPLVKGMRATGETSLYNKPGNDPVGILFRIRADIVR